MHKRKNQFKALNVESAEAWQESSRALLFRLLRLSELVGSNGARQARSAGLPLNEKIETSNKLQKYTWHDLTIDLPAPSGWRWPSAPRLALVLTVPNSPAKSFPAVVCLHGHGGNRRTVYESTSDRNKPFFDYKRFAHVLAGNGFVTVSPDMCNSRGVEKPIFERVWDVIRCMDFLVSRKEVDPERIGCAGLSMGGEMAMWLGALDTRVRACVCCGSLTTVANLRDKHCPCWDFPGLTESFDMPDIYSLIAPRPLMCQIGDKERPGGGFPVDFARQAMNEIRKCYNVFGREDAVALHIHRGGHEVDVSACLKFLSKTLGLQTVRISD